jgi:hypothetical protein
MAITAPTVEIGMENAVELGSLSREFQFVDPRRRVGELGSQHPHVEFIQFKSLRGASRGVGGG